MKIIEPKFKYLGEEGEGLIIDIWQDDYISTGFDGSKNKMWRGAPVDGTDGERNQIGPGKCAKTEEALIELFKAEV